MKGFLSKLGGPAASTGDIGGPGGSGAGGGFVGRQFCLSRHQVVVEEKLAEGGFALVFRVRSMADGRVYALKRMCVNDELNLQVCMLEVTLARSITHKNIVRYVDHTVHHQANGVSEVLLLLVYYRRNLVDLLSRSSQSGCHLPEQQVLRIFCDVCEAVARLHHRRPPVQHRDLKAENVLVDEDGNCVLCDFGSASERPLQPAVQGVGQVEEEIQKYTTLSYRSPEMIDLYSGATIDTKADIWALGCLLYRLAYLTLPFGESTLAISSARLCTPDRPPTYSEGLRRLMRYAMQPDPGARPDIHQLSSLACGLAGRVCDVGNPGNSIVPQLDSLPLPPSESENRAAAATTTLRRSPSAGHLQQQQQQVPAAATAQKPPQSQQQQLLQPSARQRPRPGGSAATAATAGWQPQQSQQQQQQPQLLVSIDGDEPQPTPPTPQTPQHPQQQQQATPTLDPLSASMHTMHCGGGLNAGQFRHRRLVSDTSALMLRPAPLFSAAAAASPLSIADEQARHRGMSLEKLPDAPVPMAPLTGLLVDLDSPPPPTATTTPHHPPAAAAPPPPPPLEDSVFGAEFDRIRGAGLSQTNLSAQPPPPQPLAPATPMSAASLAASRPAAVRPALLHASLTQQQRMQQQRPVLHQQQHWGGSASQAPRHPSQAVNQRMFWPG